MRKIIHIDMDAFYTSVEALDNPDLRGKPVIVGGDPDKRGVVSSASYEARAFGVRSAMPMWRAVRLCPAGVVIRPRMHRYQEVAEQLWAIHQTYTDLVEPIALDECYLDVTVNKKGLPSATTVAQAIKAEIREKTGLTASAGVAPNKFLAKIASDLKKPDGLVVIKPHEVAEFLKTLPVGKLWGVGPVTERKLDALGVRTIEALGGVPPERLVELFGKFGLTMHRLAQGEDDRPVVPDREPKQLSAEVTFERDTADLDVLRDELARQAGIVIRRLTAQGKQGRTVTLKLRYDDFIGITRSHTRPAPVTTVDEIVHEAVALLEKTEIGRRRVRLIGVGVSNFDHAPAAQQASLFPE
ncbi:MAG: DNA polymerase IV [Candidatus Latescibacteria bacterium]|nr:DNA polymerase IV [Candidatus Latescibacterota bacterium]